MLHNIILEYLQPVHKLHQILCCSNQVTKGHQSYTFHKNSLNNQESGFKNIL